jgi:hypothetical protein
MQFNIGQMRELEQMMDSMSNAAYALCDNREDITKVNNLRYLVAEMRVLATNPKDSDAIDRFTSLFTK